MKNILCKIFGHRMYFDTVNVAGPSTCKRCGHKRKGVVWPRPPFRLPSGKDITEEEIEKVKMSYSGDPRKRFCDEYMGCPTISGQGKKHEKYRPAWCAHPPFTDVDYCFGLAMAVADGTQEWFLANQCRGCEFHKDYKPPEPPPPPPPPPARKIKEGPIIIK